MSAAGLPLYEPNLFAPPALRDPFPHYRAIRDLAPVVRLAEPDVLVLARYDDVRAALRAADILISSKGIGFNAVVNTPRPNPSTINSDGARHRLLRGTLNRFLMPKPLDEWRATLRGMIDGRVQTLAASGASFDAMAELAQYLPVEVVSHLAGLPQQARLTMLRWAAASFNTMGVPGTGEQRRQFDADMTARQEVQSFLRAIDPADLAPGSWGDKLMQMVAGGRIDLDEARAALAAFVLPSLDTTIYAQGNMLYDLGRHPEQWEKLRSNPALVSATVMESLRHLPVVRWFSRVAASDYEAGTVRIAAGSRVMLLYGSANRDERHYLDPDRFEITRPAMDQLAWGSGPHMCAGMHLARMEMEALLHAMLEHVERFEVGEPQVGENQGLFGFQTLPMRLH